MTYGLRDDLQITLGTGATIESSSAAERVRGLNDLSLSGKYKFYDAAQRKKQEDAPHILKMSLAAALSLPTANRDRGLGSGSYDAGGFFC